METFQSLKIRMARQVAFLRAPQLHQARRQEPLMHQEPALQQELTLHQQQPSHLSHPPLRNGPELSPRAQLLQRGPERSRQRRLQALRRPKKQIIKSRRSVASFLRPRLSCRNVDSWQGSLKSLKPIAVSAFRDLHQIGASCLFVDSAEGAKRWLCL